MGLESAYESLMNHADDDCVAANTRLNEGSRAVNLKKTLESDFIFTQALSLGGVSH